MKKFHVYELRILSWCLCVLALAAATPSCMGAVQGEAAGSEGGSGPGGNHTSGGTGGENSNESGGALGTGGDAHLDGHAGSGGTSMPGDAGSQDDGSGGASSGGAPMQVGGTNAGGTQGLGGTGGAGTGGATVDAGVPDAASAGVPTFVVVGYGGLRVRSTNLGLTWTDSQRLGGGGDDQYLLRTVTYGNGVFVAAGWQIHTSPDGRRWTQRTNPENQWLGGVRYGNGRFVAAGGYGYSAYSLDGINWLAGSSRGTDAARSLAYGSGAFVASADSGNWWRTTNGMSWSNIGGGHSGRVVFCGNEFRDASQCNLPIARNGGRTAFGEGVYISVSGHQVLRSTNGTTWTDVYTASDSLEDVAFGYARE